MQQRRLDRPECVDRRHDVGDHDSAHWWRLLVFLRLHEHMIEAAQRMHHRRVGALPGTRSFLSETRYRAIDQLGISRRQTRIIETEPRHDAGPVVLDYDV